MEKNFTKSFVTKIWIKKNSGSKNFRVKKIFSQKFVGSIKFKFGQKDFGVQKRFWSKNILVKKIWGNKVKYKRICGLKTGQHLWDDTLSATPNIYFTLKLFSQQNFCPKRFFWPHKFFLPQTFLPSFFEQKKVNPKTFLTPKIIFKQIFTQFFLLQ